MSNEATCEPVCESVTETHAHESVESMIKPSDEFVEIFKSAFVSCRNRSQYSKKQIKAIETKMGKLYRKVINLENVALDDIITLAHAYRTVGCAYMEEEKLHLAVNFISASLNLIKDKGLDRRTILIALEIYDYAGNIYSKQKNTEKAMQSYDKAVELCLTYREKGEEYGCPIDFDNIVMPGVTVCGYIVLNLTYKHILKSLIKLHRDMVPKNEQSLMECKHLQLVAELSELPKTKKYFDWFLKAMKLCKDMINYGCLVEPESYFYVASFVKEAYISKKYNNMNKPERHVQAFEMDTEDTNLAYILNECVIKHHLVLMRMSARRLLLLEETEDFAINLKSEHPSTSKLDIAPKLLMFKRINIIPKSDEQPPTTLQYISGYNIAYETFVTILSYLNVRKSYFNIDEDIEAHARLILDNSNAYKYMALYEKDKKTRLYLQNQHVDILSKGTKKKIFSTRTDVLKYLQFQLALGYSILIDEKFESLDVTHLLYMPQRYNAIMFEIDRLVERALANLKMFERKTCDS